MTILFGRAIEITVGTTKITELRMGFNVKRSLRTEPNTAEVKIYNLSSETRSKLQAEKVIMLIEAGYKETIAQLFKGEVREVKTPQSGTDLITSIQGGDGEVQTRQSRVNLSFAKGTKVPDILSSLGNLLGLNVKKALEKLRNGKIRGSITELVNGFAASGRTMTEFERLVRSSGFEMSIQDGEVQILDLGKPNDLPAISIDAQSGLIGVPEVGEKGRVKARSLLQPGMIPGRTLKITSEAAELDGRFYRIQEVEHIGDTHGQDWYSDVEGNPI